MSKYYQINGLKVRVSDHEPNFSMDKFRGRADVEFYTISADNIKLSVVDQIGYYCDKHDLDPDIFKEVAKDFPDPEYISVKSPTKIEVTQEVVDGYRAISGKGSMSKKEKYCERIGVDSFKMSQGYYTVVKSKNQQKKGGGFSM
tara:strand:+ start:2587 stop:3018 length:432 start_codon:yes stop_codon:yes gene_type:complete